MNVKLGRSKHNSEVTTFGGIYIDNIFLDIGKYQSTYVHNLNVNIVIDVLCLKSIDFSAFYLHKHTQNKSDNVAKKTYR